MEQKQKAPTAKMIRLGDGAYISVFMNGESLLLKQAESPKNFQEALEADKAKDWDRLYKAMKPVKAYFLQMDGVTVQGEEVLYRNKPLHNVVTDRILEFCSAGLDSAPLCKFLAKLMENPSSRAVNELYTFLEHKNLPITENGNFLAYKGIQTSFYSVTGGQLTLLNGKAQDGHIYNGVGEEIEVPRNEVDDNCNNGCSKGLHVGSLEYAVGFGSQTVVVEVNPKDVVSVPLDCSYQKVRVCKYKVVDLYSGPLTQPLYDSRYEDDCCCDDTCYDEEDDDYYNSEGYLNLARLIEDEMDEMPELVDDEVEPLDEPVPQAQLELQVEDDFEVTDSSWLDWVTFFMEKDKHPAYHNGYLVLLTQDGRELGYKNVPWAVYQDFRRDVESGASAGKYYNQNIRDCYEAMPNV